MSPGDQRLVFNHLYISSALSLDYIHVNEIDFTWSLTRLVPFYKWSLRPTDQHSYALPVQLFLYSHKHDLKQTLLSSDRLILSLYSEIEVVETAIASFSQYPMKSQPFCFVMGRVLSLLPKAGLSIPALNLDQESFI